MLPRVLDFNWNENRDWLQRSESLCLTHICLSILLKRANKIINTKTSLEKNMILAALVNCFENASSNNLKDDRLISMVTNWLNTRDQINKFILNNQAIYNFHFSRTLNTAFVLLDRFIDEGYNKRELTKIFKYLDYDKLMTSDTIIIPLPIYNGRWREWKYRNMDQEEHLKALSRGVKSYKDLFIWNYDIIEGMKLDDRTGYKKGYIDKSAFMYYYDSRKDKLNIIKSLSHGFIFSTTLNRPVFIMTNDTIYLDPLYKTSRAMIKKHYKDFEVIMEEITEGFEVTKKPMNKLYYKSFFNKSTPLTPLKDLRTLAENFEVNDNYSVWYTSYLASQNLPLQLNDLFYSETIHRNQQFFDY